MSALHLAGGRREPFLDDGRVAQGLVAGARRIDRTGAEIMPGAVNAHTHLYSGLAPLGMPAPPPAPESFLQILERVWWRLDRALDAPSLRAAARLYVAEALLAGTTTLVDHHESPAFIQGSLDVLADAAQELGCRLVTGYGATERNGGREEARAGLAECARFVRHNRRPLVRGMVALHASFTVGDDTIREAGALCRELGVPLHVHVAEDRADVEDARRRGYPGPLERLIELDALPPGSVLAHGVHLDADQVRRAAAAGAWLVHNPRSNAGNGVGFAHALAASPRVALGTDGYPADMRAERAALIDAGVDAATTAERAACGTAIATERFGETIADEVVVRDAAVRHVVVAGSPMVEDGRLVQADIEQIRAEARQQAPRLFERMQRL